MMSSNHFFGTPGFGGISGSVHPRHIHQLSHAGHGAWCYCKSVLTGTLETAPEKCLVTAIQMSCT